MIEIVDVGLNAFLEILSVVICLHYLYGEKLSFEMTTVSFVIIDVVWMVIGQLLNANLTWSLMMYPIVILYCGIKFGFKIKAIFVNNILYIIILSGVQATIMILFSIMLRRTEVNTLDSLVINVIVLSIVFGILRKCKLKKISDILQSNEMIVKISLVVIIICIILFLIGYKQKRSFEVLYYIMLGVSLALIVLAVMDIGKHKIEAKEAEAELRLHKLYESSFRELIDEVCARQHEFDNHINVIYSQHRMYKTYDELVEAQKIYCNDIIEENHFNKILSNGNPVILCFLYSKFSEMHRKGIEVTYKINIGELNCGMPVHKIVELLGNLIKNAMEAVCKSEKGKIHIVMLEDDRKIQIEVGNESKAIEEKKIKDFFRKGYTEKGNNRGYGLYNVAKICENYHAAIICKNEDVEGENWLVFKIIINKPL